MLLLLFSIGLSISFDYEDDVTKTIVSKVFLGTGEVTAVIPMRIVEIQSNKDVSSFSDVRNFIEEVEFEENSNIKKIGSYCFYQCTVLKKVDLSKCINLTILNEYIFSDCSSLKEIIFPPCLDQILQYCFYKCSSLEEFLLPNNTSLLSQCSFYLCTKLKIFHVTPGLKSINNGVFFGCSSLAEIIYLGTPSLTNWGPYALGKSIIKSFYIPKCVESIGFSLFENCNLITEINIEEGSKFYFDSGILFADNNKTIHIGLKLIEGVVNVSLNIEKVSSHVFKNCDKIIEINFLNQNTKFEGSDHFYGCTLLQKVTLPSSISFIAVNMFMYCVSIGEIILPSTVTQINSKAFLGCKNLKHLHLSANITSFGSGAFSGIPSDINITSDDGSSYIMENNHLYGSNYSSVIAFIGDSGDVTIPPSAITINGNAYDNKLITSITFPEDSKLQNIMNCAFRYCSKLKKILLPNTVKIISNFAFEGCTAIEEFSFGTSLTEIGEKAFFNFGSISGIKATDLPDTLISIGESAFEKSKFTELLIGSNSNLKNVGERAFYETSMLNSISFSTSLTTIGKSILTASSISKLSFNDKCPLETISIEAFLNCTFLKEIVISSNVKKIDERAFSGCNQITSIMLGSSVESISYQAFGGCSSLNSFIIPPQSQLTEIMGQAFFECFSLKTFTIFGSNEFEAQGGILYGKGRKILFTYLSGSEDKIVKIDEGVERINKFAFQLATSIEEVYLPSTLSEIGFRSFDRCLSLKKLYIGGNKISTEVEAFRECTALKSCESVVLPTEDEDNIIDLIWELKKGGIYEGCFEECSSFLFTLGNGSHHSMLTMASVLLNKSD